MRRGGFVSLVVAAALLSACSPTAEIRDGTIIDDGDGPLLCDEIQDSYPPACVDGTPVDGWDWDAVPHEEQDGVRWGDYRSMTVTRDGDRVRVQVTIATIEQSS